MKTKRVVRWSLMALAAVAAAVTFGTYGAQLVVLCLTVGIFVGTVSIRGPRAGAETATTPHGL